MAIGADRKRPTLVVHPPLATLPTLTAVMASLFIVSTDVGYARCAAAAPASVVAAFTDDPRRLLEEYPRGGIALELISQSLLVSGTKARRSMGELIYLANASQGDAIVAAFENIYSSCEDHIPGLARDIDEIVRSSTNPGFRRILSAYLANQHPTPEPQSEHDDAVPARKLGLNKLSIPEFRNPKRPLPLPGSTLFD